MAFVVARKCLQYIKPLTVNLQKKAQDIVSAFKDVARVSQCIKDIRETGEETFKAWFQETTTMAEELSTTVEAPRQAAKQTLRDNPPADTSEEFF